MIAVLWFLLSLAAALVAMALQAGAMPNFMPHLS
jgi:hypothetical protein